MGLHAARGDRLDADAERAELEGNALAPAFESPLACVIDRVEGKRLIRPPIEVVLMISPAPFSRRWGMNAFVVRMAPIRFVLSPS